MKILARCTSAVCPVTWAHLLNKEGLGDQLKDALSHQLDSTLRSLVVDPATTTGLNSWPLSVAGNFR